RKSRLLKPERRDRRTGRTARWADGPGGTARRARHAGEPRPGTQLQELTTRDLFGDRRHATPRGEECRRYGRRVDSAGPDCADRARDFSYPSALSRSTGMNRGAAELLP